MNTILKNYSRIKSEDVPSFIRENFGKVEGTLSCLNPHWWVYFHPHTVVYEYQCCDYEDCTSMDYEEYKDPEMLIKDHLSILTDNDDWWWFS